MEKKMMKRENKGAGYENNRTDWHTAIVMHANGE